MAHKMSKKGRRRKQTFGDLRPKPTIFDLHTTVSEPVLVAIPVTGPPPIPPKLRSLDMSPPPISPVCARKPGSLSTIIEGVGVSQFFQAQPPRYSSSRRQLPIVGETNSVESYEELQVVLAAEQTPKEPFAINLTGEFVLEIVREAMSLVTAIDMDALPEESKMEAFDFMNLVRAEIAKVMECRRPNVTRSMLGPDGPKLVGDSAEVLLQPGSMLVLKRCAGSLLNLMEKFKALNLPQRFTALRAPGAPQETLDGDQGVKKEAQSTVNKVVMPHDVGERGSETETETTLIWAKNTNMESEREVLRIEGSKDGDREEEIPLRIFQPFKKLESCINSALDVCRSAIAESTKFETTHKPRSPSTSQI